jgi:hypothetical protein
MKTDGPTHQKYIVWNSGDCSAEIKNSQNFLPTSFIQGFYSDGDSANFLSSPSVSGRCLYSDTAKELH